MNIVDAARGEVRDVGAGRLALGARHPGLQGVGVVEAQIRDVVVRRLGTVGTAERLAVLVALEIRDLLGQWRVRARVVGIERGWILGLSVQHDQLDHRLSCPRGVSLTTADRNFP